MLQTAYYPFYYDGYNEYSDFRDKYKEKFGKPVYVGPYMRWKWYIYPTLMYKVVGRRNTLSAPNHPHLHTDQWVITVGSKVPK